MYEFYYGPGAMIATGNHKIIIKSICQKKKITFPFKNSMWCFTDEFREVRERVPF